MYIYVANNSQKYTLHHVQLKFTQGAQIKNSCIDLAVTR